MILTFDPILLCPRFPSPGALKVTNHCSAPTSISCRRDCSQRSRVCKHSHTQMCPYESLRFMRFPLVPVCVFLCVFWRTESVISQSHNYRGGIHVLCKPGNKTGHYGVLQCVAVFSESICNSSLRPVLQCRAASFA